MKNCTNRLWALLFIGCFASFSLLAQSNNVTIVKSITDGEKNTTTEEVTVELENLTAVLENLETHLEGLEGKEVELTVDFENQEGAVEQEEEVFYFRAAGSSQSDDQVKSLKIFSAKPKKAAQKDPTPKKEKAFLGVYSSMNGEGLHLDGIVSNTAAEKAGLKKGDIVMTFDNEPVTSSHVFTQLLAKQKPGNTVDITYKRDGQTATTQATLGAKKVHNSYANYYHSDDPSNWGPDRDPCAVFIGVTTNTHYRAEGVTIIKIVEDTPAEAAGLERGDIITAIDGVNVNTFNDLRTERDKHEAGDEFSVTYTREGVSQTVVAQFKSCDQEEEVIEEPVEEVVEEVVEEIVEETPPVLPINNTLVLEDLTVYPNPTYGKLNVRFEAEALPTVVRITDVNGKEVYREQLNSFGGYYQKEIDLTNATPGLMSVTIQQGDKVKGEKAILLPRA